MNMWCLTVRRKIALHQKLIFLGLVVCLAAWGLLVLYEASYYFSMRIYKNPHSIFYRQLIFLAQGLLIFLIIQKIDLSRFLKWPYLWLALAAILPLLAFVPLIGHEIAGATIWLTIPLPWYMREEIHTGLLSLVCFFIAIHIYNAEAREWTRMEKATVTSVFCWISILLLKQPDMIFFILLGAFSIYYLFLAGRIKTVLALIIFVCLVLSYYYLGPQYIRMRTYHFDAFYSSDYLTSTAYQVLQSLYAFQDGGWTGVGLENVELSRWNLAGVQGEFIFSVVGKAYGLAGVAIYILAMLAFIHFGLMAARRVSDMREAAVLKFFVFLVGISAFCHIAVTIDLLPVFAMPLPFFSNRGEFLIITFFTAGWIYKNLRSRAVHENESNDIETASNHFEHETDNLLCPSAITLSVGLILFARAVSIALQLPSCFPIYIG